MIWLSFADPKAPKGEGFRGACLVDADGFVAAVQLAWKLKINPGGQVLGVEFDNSAGRFPLNKLMTAAEIRRYENAP